MAIRALMLRKKIDEKNKALADLRAKTEGFEARKTELETRESELETAIEEASTDDERAAVEEAVTALENDKAALDQEVAENGDAIANLETEVAELEKDLEDSESRTVVQAPPKEQGAKEDAPKKTTKKREGFTMLKTRTLREMSLEARDAFVQREDVQACLAQVRTFIAEKRTVSGAQYTIPEVILGLIRENIMEYSKLISRVNLQSRKADGRMIIQGVAPEAIWLECCDAIPEVDIAFGKVELDCYKVAAYFAVCNAAVEDSDIDLLDALSVALLQALGKALDKAIIYGSGTKMPTGVVPAIAADSDLDDTNLVTISGSAHGTDLIKAIIIASGNANNEYSRGEKTWVMNEKTYTKLISECVEVDGAGAIVAGVNGRMPVVGGDIIVLNFMPDDNIVMGYFDLYILLERLGFEVAVSTEVKFLDDQTVLRAKGRYDGKPAIIGAFVAMGLGKAPSTSAVFPSVS